MSNDVVSKALGELKECAAKEADIEKLRQLVVEINNLLDIVEGRLAELEGGRTLN